MNAFVYLLVCADGGTYLGSTSDLRRRLREHNSVSNTGYTKNKRWHLLAVERCASRREAFSREAELKRDAVKRGRWKRANIVRAQTIFARFGYEYDFIKWLPKERGVNRGSGRNTKQIIQGLIDARKINSYEELIKQVVERRCQISRRGNNYLGLVTEEGGRFRVRFKFDNSTKAALDEKMIAAESCDDESEVGSLVELLAYCIGRLADGRDREVLNTRVGLSGCGVTLSRLGDEFGVTRERIRQLEARGIRKLRPPPSELALPSRLKKWLGEVDSEKLARVAFDELPYGYHLTIFKVLAKIAQVSAASAGELISDAERALSSLRTEKAQENRDQQFEDEMGIPFVNGRVSLDLSKVLEWAWTPAGWGADTGYKMDSWKRCRTPAADSTSEFEKGKFWSRKNQRPIYYDSGVERAVLGGLEQDERVLWYVEQPFKIEYDAPDGSRRFYFPDVLVCLDGQGIIVVEVKPVIQMIQEVNVAKFSALKRFCFNNGFAFAVTDGKVSAKQLVATVGEEDCEAIRKFVGRDRSLWSVIRSMKHRSGYSVRQLVGAFLRRRIYVNAQMICVQS